MTGISHMPKAEASTLFSRSASKAILGTHSGHSFGDLPGPSPAQLFQDSGLLYMAQELPMADRTRMPRPPEQGDSSLAEDSSEGYKEEILGGRGEKPPPQAVQPGTSVVTIHLSVCEGSLPVSEDVCVLICLFSYF